jgi:hypothetical protein
MSERSKNLLLVGLGLALAFSLGTRFGGGLEPEKLQAGPNLATPVMPEPQGRRVGSGGSSGSTTPPTGTGTPGEAAPLVWESGSGGSASAGGIIAVTGSYGVGTSVLYVIDAKTRQLAVYEARGGSRSGRRVVLVGARRIDLDLQLEGYRDESEHSYEELRKRFGDAGLLGPGGSSKGISAPSKFDEDRR